MADRLRHSRGSDQFVADQTDELSRLSLQYFFERPSCLYRRHDCADRDHLRVFSKLHHASAQPNDLYVGIAFTADGRIHSIFITYSLAMMAFWILEISTIVFIIYSFEYFLGGQMFPIDIMPAGVQAVMKWLPFYYELFCPIAIFLERLKGPELLQAIAIQTGWLLLTWAAARTMWKRGLGHYQAVGG